MRASITAVIASGSAVRRRGLAPHTEVMAVWLPVIWGEAPEWRTLTVNGKTRGEMVASSVISSWISSVRSPLKNPWVKKLSIMSGDPNLYPPHPHYHFLDNEQRPPFLHLYALTDFLL
jgi:hypothetical protein